MKTTFQQLLDELREKAGGSDRKAGPSIGITQQSFSSWRRGLTYPDDTQALKIAAALGKPAAFVLAAIRADRTTSREARRIWMKIAESYAAVLAFVAVGVPLAVPGFVAQVLSGSCVLCQIRRPVLGGAS